MSDLSSLAARLLMHSIPGIPAIPGIHGAVTINSTRGTVTAIVLPNTFINPYYMYVQVQVPGVQYIQYIQYVYLTAVYHRYSIPGFSSYSSTGNCTTEAEAAAAGCTG